MSGTKISAALDIGTVAGTDMVPVARVGSTTAYHATITEILNAGTIAAGVSSWNTRTGAVTLTIGDISAAGGAPLASPAMTGVPTVPTAAPGANTAQAASTAFVQAATGVAQAAAPNNTGRNLLHNGLMNVQQRGTTFTVGPANTTMYGPDRWYGVFGSSSDAMTITMTAHTDANRAAIGDEAAQWLASLGFTGGTAAGAIVNFAHRIENVRRLAGKTVTVSWWATASAAMNIGVSLYQIFGSGGSPSTGVFAPTQIVAIGTTWATRYSATFVVPSAAGKTFGTTAGTDFTQLAFTLSNPAVAGYPIIPAQSGTIMLWGLQLEIGSVATPLEKLDPRMDLSNCQRFYQSLPGLFFSAFSTSAGQPMWGYFGLLVNMRATPTVAFSATTYNNASAVALNGAAPTLVELTASITAAGTAWVSTTASISADL